MSKRAWRAYVLCGFGLLAVSACGDDADNGGGDSKACSDLCVAGGFEGGSQMDFDKVTECLCEGSAGAIAQTACASYCDAFDVPADKSFLSSERLANDKCVCDGTSLPGGNTGDANTGGSTGDANTGGSTGDANTGGSTGDANTGGNGDVTLDPQGYPEVPDDALGTGEMGTIHVSITQSTLQKLSNGTYVAPYSPNGSSGSSVSFLDPGFVFGKDPVLQVQINLPSNKMSGTWECKTLTDMLLRYGNPPSGANQLVVTSCSIDYVYEASNDSYTGKITADVADAYTQDPVPVPTEMAKLKAGFAFPGKE
jgi:hypothetical protein